MLKSEYETIPKVARYLSTNQLLNPTHQASPLTSDQFNQLNHRFASLNGFLPDTFLQDAPYLRKRRRKRSANDNNGNNNNNNNSNNSNRYKSPSNGIGIPIVAEMLPNTTLLVVSSAHSAGRIGNTHASFRSNVSNFNDSMSSGEPTTGLAAVITKDGYKSIAPSSSLSYTQGAATNRQQSQQQPQSVGTQRAANYYSWAPSIGLASQSSGYNKHSSEAAPLSSSWINAADNPAAAAAAANKSQKLVQTLHTSSSARSGANQVSIGGDNGQQERQQTGSGQSSLSSQSSSQQVSAVNTINSQSSSTGGTTANQNHATSAKESRSEQHNSDDAFDNAFGQGRSNGMTISTPTTTASSSTSSVASEDKPKATTLSNNNKKHETSKGYRLGCNESGNGFTTV